MVVMLRIGLALSCLALQLLSSVPPSDASSPDGPGPGAWIEAQLPDLVALYEHLHAHPELSLREVETAKRMAAELREAGFDVTTGVGGFGVVGVLENGEGPTVMLRADMDALPIGERTGLPYASKLRSIGEDGEVVGGVMHACGHDVHMVNLVGCARWLGEHQRAWRGTAVLIAQPAEEVGAGAKAMLEAGLFERFPRPDFGLSLHVQHDLRADTIGYCSGPFMANVESCDIVVRGRGGHGAAPHLTIDPVPIAAGLVLDLQTIVARELDPLTSAVVTVGSIQGGTKHNVIADSCRLRITIRSTTPEDHDAIKRAIERKARAAAAAAGAPEPEVTFSEFTPVLVNDPELTARLVPGLRDELGAERVVEVPRVMTGEDFGRYGVAGVPVFMFRLGTIEAERLAALRREGFVPPLHSGGFWPDPEPTIRTGLRASITGLRELLGRPARDG
jgi:amidohydrolase